MLTRIISGGQTGVDRAALDVALQQGIDCGGWVPKGRLAEDGIIPPHYPHLVETDSSDPKERTACNVRDSDATLIITRGLPAGGSAFTMEIASRFNKPVLHLDLERESTPLALRRVLEWGHLIRPAILNIAGPRSSEDREIYALAKALLEQALPVWNVRE